MHTARALLVLSLFSLPACVAASDGDGDTVGTDMAAISTVDPDEVSLAPPSPEAAVEATRDRFIDIQMENETTIQGDDPPRLVQANDVFTVMTSPNRAGATKYELTRSNGNPYRGNGALRLRLPPNKPISDEDSKKTDHLEVVLAHPTLDADRDRALGKRFFMRSGERLPHYLGFAMKFAPEYDVPRTRGGSVLHMQLFQEGGVPPVALRIEPNENPRGPIRYYLGVRKESDRYGSNHDETAIVSGELQRGDWYHFAFKFVADPRSESNGGFGEIEMWLNGKRKVRYKDGWGYVPGKVVDGHRGGDVFRVTVGTYRARQELEQTISLDSIRYGTTLKSVLP